MQPVLATICFITFYFLLSRNKPVFLPRFVTSTLAFRKAYRMWVCENRLFGPKRDDVIAGLRKLHIRELNKFYSLRIIIEMIK
jgi:hypothetical protein